MHGQVVLLADFFDSWCTKKSPWRGDAVEDFEDDEEIYDELNLDKEEAAFGRVGGDDGSDESDSEPDGMCRAL